MTGMTKRSRRRMLAAATAGVTAALLLAAPVAAATADPATSEHPVTMTPELEAQIQGMVEGFLDDNPSVPGISIAVVTPDAEGPDPRITTFAAGVADRESGAPVQASTQFELGSETKVFTADLLAYLVAQGTVSLDDPVQKYAPSDVVVPEWVDPVTQEKTPITLLDLATHTAGLTDGAPNLQDGCPKGHDECANPKPGYTPAMLWDSFSKDCADKRLCPLWKPGTAWNYSNWGFALLGDIVAGLITPGDVPAGETGPGRVFQDSLETTFLNQLGMTSTTVEFPDTTPATPYNGADPIHRWNNYDAYVGGGGLISNADDMGAFVAASLGYLPADAPAGLKAVADTVAPVVPITLSCTPAGPVPTPTPTPTPSPSPATTAAPSDTCTTADFAMGLGWERYAARAEGITVPYAHKNGGTAGSSTDTLLAPSLRIGVTSMFNQNAAGIDQLAPRILSLLIASPATPAPARDATLADTGADAVVPVLAASLSLLAGIAVLLRRRSIIRRRSV